MSRRIVGSSQDSRLRGRHKRSDTIRGTACLVELWLLKSRHSAAACGMRSNKSQGPCGCYRAYSLYRERRGRWT